MVLKSFTKLTNKKRKFIESNNNFVQSSTTTIKNNIFEKRERTMCSIIWSNQHELITFRL